VSVRDLTDREQVAFGVLSFLVSDVISQMINTPLDKGEDKIIFEAVSTCTVPISRNKPGTTSTR
jgi:hypothetical protein